MSAVKVIRLVRTACRFQADDLVGKGVECPECSWQETYSYTNGKLKAVGYGSRKEITLECDRCECQFVVKPQEDT